MVLGKINVCSSVTLSLNQLRHLGQLPDLAMTKLMLDQLLLNIPYNHLVPPYLYRQNCYHAKSGLHLVMKFY